MKTKLLASIMAMSMVVTTAAGMSVTVFADDSKDDLVIGAVYPMTGDLANSGKTMKQGIEMALSEINDEGGIDGRKVTVIYGDTQGKADVGMSEAERLITQEKVNILMGCYQSGVTATVSQVAQQYGVPMVTANATSDNLTANGYDYFFRLPPTNMMFIRDMLQFVLDEKEKNSDFKASSVAVFADNTEVGQQTSEWTEYWAKEDGLDYLGTVSYTPGAADLSSEVLQLQGMNPDVVIADHYVSDAILFTNTLVEQGYLPPIIICKGNGFTEPAYLESVGDSANGMVVATEFVVGSKGQDVTDKYHELYGEDMNGHSAEAYCTTRTICDAFKNIVEAGGTIDYDSIQKELSEIKIDGKFSDGQEIILPYDTISFEENEFNGMKYLNQNLAAKLTITQIQDGKYVPIYPFDIAQSDLIYPAQYQ